MDIWESTSILTAELNDDSIISLDDDDHDVYPWSKLLQHINDFYLDGLRACFKEKCFDVEDPKKVDLSKGLNKEQFISAVGEVFGNTKFTPQAISIFNEIDKDDTREITWDQFLDFAHKQLMPIVNIKLTLGEPKILPCPHVKRETIMKILPIETEKYFCYVLISKHGCVGLYDGNMNFLLSYTILMAREDLDRSDEERRRKNRWVTDAIFVLELQMFIVTNSARSIAVYDASNLHHIPLWLILGCPSIITSLSFHRDNNKAILYAGNEYGAIITFDFQQPDGLLFRKKHNDKMSFYYWLELRNEKEYVIVHTSENIHQEGINFVQVFGDNKTVLTCSRDAKKSVIIRTLDNRIPPYVFKMKKGANCCCLSRQLKLLITGSEDGVVRVWNIFMTSSPIHIFDLHRRAIVDVAIIESQSISLTCSRDGILNVWDLNDFTCLQTVEVKFPSLSELGKVVEWGKNSICRGPKRAKIEQYREDEDLLLADVEDDWERTNILLTCCNNVVRLDINFLDGKLRNLHCRVLPPPPLQNSVLIPSNWNISEEKSEIKCEMTKCDEKLEEYIKSLSFVLQKDFLSENNLNNEINFRIAKLESKKLQMKNAVEQGAPYLALDLPEIERLELSPNLPVPSKKKIKNLVAKTHRLLAEASSRSAIFSTPSPTSSSRTRSNRSSIIEFD